MKKEKGPVTPKLVKETHQKRRKEIRARLREFSRIIRHEPDERIWEEMVFCFFTGGCSAKMGMRGIEATRHLLQTGDFEQLSTALSGIHRYPFARSRYIVASRAFLHEHCGMQLRKKLRSFGDHNARRDWLVREKGIKGLGYKEASHFLRNIGYKGYGILDKHVLNCLADLGVIEDPKPPGTRAKYLAVEEKLADFADTVEINFDELDLVLWSLKTGEILK